MKYAGILLVALALAGCGEPVEQGTQAGQQDQPGAATGPTASPSGAGEYTVSGPYTHDNLAVFLLHKKGAATSDVGCVTMEEALQKGWLKVTEKEEGAEVNELQVENVGGMPIYLQAGDTVKGGQQDRTIAIDFILEPKSGKTGVQAFCVEPGRWSGRDGVQDFPGVALAFDEAPAPVVTKEQKLAVRLDKSQEKVWEEGRGANSSLYSNSGLASPSESESFVLVSENPEVQKKAAEYEKALQEVLKDKKDVVGVAYAVNGELSTIDIYASSPLFLKLWPKLLKSCSLEALAKKSDKPVEKTVKVEDVHKLLAEGSKVEPKTEDLNGAVQIDCFDAPDAAQFDTKNKGDLIHRQVIKK